MTILSFNFHALVHLTAASWTRWDGETAIPAKMSFLNLNNVINATLVVGAFLSGFSLTSRANETGEHMEAQDLAGMTKGHTQPDKSNGIMSQDKLKT